MQRCETGEMKPYFYDITLRDGNQSLKKPWSLEEKQLIFDKIVELNIPAIEIGFPASSEMDFLACQNLANRANENTRVSVLARANKNDIDKALLAIKDAKCARLHTFITMSPFHMENVLNKSAAEVSKIAIEAVKYAKSEIDKLNKNFDIEFSVEHFGDCESNIDFVIETLKQITAAGATTINLPNTVERYRPSRFINLVKKVKENLDDDVIISVHNHNDLGMATATTVESFFAGAKQLECCLNGLGERAGNTDFNQVVTVLHNNNIETGIDLSKIYETSLLISQMSHIKIYEKAPLVGPEALAHRSGIHQDGAIKTKDMYFGAYRPIHPTLIGRYDDEKIGFTSQSGKTAIYDIIKALKYPITIQESIYLTPFAKHLAEQKGELNNSEILDLYFDKICDIKGVFELISFKEVEKGKYSLTFNFKNKKKEITDTGNGPLDACLNGLRKLGFETKLLNYKQYSLDGIEKGSSARAMSAIAMLDNNNNEIIARAIDTSTALANVKAIFNALNQMYK